MASREEARQALARRLEKYKIQRPVRVCYLGDGRGYSASNMYVPGETDKVWARESQGGGKPFKLLNRTPNVKVSFNMPVLVGYPESDPDNEQILGTHWGGLVFSDNASAISGTDPHHTQHEWGGGDEISVDPRQFLPGLVAPTNPPSMAVRLLAFQHHVYGFKRFNNSFSDDVSGYKPVGASTYRYVLFTVDPRTNEPKIRPGSVFTADLSIDSILANQGLNTFRHIPSPPGDEIPLGAVLLDPDTTTLNWRIGGVNNIFPLRLLLSTPTTLLNERVDTIESALGLDGAAQTGAGLGISTDLLPSRIDGNLVRLELNRAPSFEGLPSLRVGELGYINDSPSALAIGTASGNKTIEFGSGGGYTALSQLSDVTLSDLTNWRALQFDPAISAWKASSIVRALNLVVGSCPIPFGTAASGQIAALIVDDQGARTYAADGQPTALFTLNAIGMQIGGTEGAQEVVEFNPDFDLVDIGFFNQNDYSAYFNNSDNTVRFALANSPSAIDLQYDNNRIVFNGSGGTSPLVLFDSQSRHVIFGHGSSMLEDGVFEVHSPSSLRLNSIGHFNHYSPGLNRATTYEFYFKNESGSIVQYFNQSFATVGASYGSYGLTSLSAGILRSGLFSVDTSIGEVCVNNGGLELDFRAESSANSNQFRVSAKLNAVQIGASVAGQIADFRSHATSLAAGGNQTIYIGDTSIDNNNNVVEVYGRTRQNRNSPAALPALCFVGYNRSTTDGNAVAYAFDTDTTGTGGTAGVTLAQIAGRFDTHNHSTRTGSIEFITRQSGVAGTRVVIGGGVQIGSPTGGDKGTGTINAAGDIYKNNTAYNSPDYVLEKYYSGSIVKYAKNEGAGTYPGLLPLEKLDSYMRKHNHLPTRPTGSLGIFQRADWVQEKLEEQAIYIVQLHDRIEKLEKALEELN